MGTNHVGSLAVKGEKKQDEGSMGKEAREAFLFQVQGADAGLNADGRSQERRGNSRHRGGGEP